MGRGIREDGETEARAVEEDGGGEPMRTEHDDGWGGECHNELHYSVHKPNN